MTLEKLLANLKAADVQWKQVKNRTNDERKSAALTQLNDALEQLKQAINKTIELGHTVLASSSEFSQDYPINTVGFFSYEDMFNFSVHRNSSYAESGIRLACVERLQVMYKQPEKIVIVLFFESKKSGRKI